MLRSIRIIAFASFIEGLLTLFWLASIPTAGTFSPVRLASLFGILLVSLGSLAVFLLTGKENRFARKFERVADGESGIFISWLLTTLSLALWVTILYRDQLITIVDEAAYTRFLPIAAFGVVFCLQWGLLLLIPRIDKDVWTNALGRVRKPTAILLGGFLAAWGCMSLTHIGFIFDNVGLSWGPPGTPISFPQINLVLAISLSLAFAYPILQSRVSIPLPIRDILIFLGLWGLAVVLWWNTPVSDTHFNPLPMAPNHETYPNSDALIFDRSAYHLLFGTGFSDQLVRRPLYVGMLALFHKVGGFGYENTIFLQILLLAFIPSLTYLLTSRLSNRLAGLVAGGLILLREKNAIELSDRIVTANAKLMMSDMAALLGVIAFAYVMTRVLSREDRSSWLLMVAGACLGLTALVRAQVLILIPVLLIFILWDKKPLKLRVKDSMLIMFGFVLVMLPWIWRNWSLTGTFVLDDRGEEKLLARNYSQNPVGFPDLLPGETEKEYSARIKREVFGFIIEHPSDVALFVSNHFLRNLATGAVYIAPSLSIDSLRSSVDRTQFWDEWQGALSWNSGVSVFITLMFLALGISIAQARHRSAGWFPLAVFLFYSAGNALVRTSGWRFSLPVDWVILVYYSIALSYLPSRVKLTFDGNSSPRPDRVPGTVIQKPFFGAIAFFILLLAGASVPIAERLIPARNPSGFTEDAREILSTRNILPTARVETFLEQENAVILSGIALYPRYITPNSRVYLAYTPPRDFRFLHFWLINEGNNQIVFPLENSPDVFPHTSTVTIMGCKKDNYILAWAVVLHSTPDQIFVQDGSTDINCSLNEPK